MLSLSWFQPRVGLAPWSRTQADGACREEAKGAPIPAGGGVVACWERHFPDNDPSKKAQRRRQGCDPATKIGKMNWNAPA